jgi:hypothetical protein
MIVTARSTASVRMSATYCSRSRLAIAFLWWSDGGNVHDGQSTVRAAVVDCAVEVERCVFRADEEHLL